MASYLDHAMYTETMRIFFRCMINNGEANAPSGDRHGVSEHEVSTKVSPGNNSTILASFVQRKYLPPGHLRQLLSSSSTSDDKHKQQSLEVPCKTKEILLDCKRYWQVNTSKIMYSHS